MKPTFRKNNLRARAFELCSQALMLASAFLVCLWMISGAKADEPNNLAEIKSEVSGDTRRIDIVFSRDLAADSVKTNYERDFLQFSIGHVTAFPARTVATGSGLVPKVYAYQYQPDLARARVYLTGDTRDYRDAISWKVEGARIRVVFDKAKLEEARAQRRPAASMVRTATDQVSSTTSSTEKSALTTEEEQLLKRMTDRLEQKAPATSVANSGGAASLAPTKAPVAAPAPAPAEDPLFAGMKKEPKRGEGGAAKSAGAGLAKVVLNLFLVLGLIGGIAWAFRKFVLKRGLGIGQGGKAIRVLSTFTLAPGKQITVVKVAEEYLVLGVAGNNISLISTLDRASGIEKYFGGGRGDALSEDRFAAALDDSIAAFADEAAETPVSPAAAPSAPETAAVSVRASIKDRLRGFKQLT